MEYEYLHFPAAAVQVDPLRFVALPESARVVFNEVKQRGPLTNAELLEATGATGVAEVFLKNKIHPFL